MSNPTAEHGRRLSAVTRRETDRTGRNAAAARRGATSARGRAAMGEPRAGVTRMFAAVVPGMAALVMRELAALPGVRVTDSGFDGRSDLIRFEVDRGHRDALWSLRTLEDLFVEVGHAERTAGDSARGIAGRLWTPVRVEKALSVWSAEVRPLVAVMTYRVIARVLQEHSFLRTELRTALGQAISAGRPKWRFADPSQIEVWASEYRPGQFVGGLRLSDASMRQHDGRDIERTGALRPTVAAAMVGLAAEPRGCLIDPFCGSGTILAEALAVGWQDVRGSDIDPDAVRIAGHNVPAASVRIGDARQIDAPDGTAGAVVSNLPFGKQYTISGTGMGDVLGEMARVLMSGGRTVLLVPHIPRDAIPAALGVREKVPLRLLGMKTILWTLHRC